MALSSICIASALRLTLWAVGYYESCADVQMFIQIKCTLKRDEGENGKVKTENGKVKTENGKLKAENLQPTCQLVYLSTRLLVNYMIYGLFKHEDR